MTRFGLWIIWILYPLFGAVESSTVQEFLPRTLSPYGDGLESAQILQIPLPGDLPTEEALFLTLAANVTRGCSWSNVSLYLRHGGLPIVNVQNASYPNYTWVHEPIDYEVNFLSDGTMHRMTVYPRELSNVLFGAAVLLEEVSNIQQDGLVKSCTTLFWGRAERLPLENNTLIDVTKAPTVKENAVELVRKSYSQPLTVKWVKDRSDGSQNMTSDLDISVNLRPGDDPVVYSLTILSPTDVGGTLVVDVKFNESQINSTVTVCLARGVANCQNGTKITANSSKPEEKAKIIVPYPREGEWYISLVGNCSEINGTICERNISVKVQISLSTCQEGSCGAHGRCVQYFSAGIIYSTCTCSSGFAGWSCSDGTNAISTSILLTSVLILTLSNLFFIPAVVLSFLRGFYPQCLMYLVTMVFSTFYHACDQPEFSYCLMPYSILQFGDFYSSLTSVWLTALIVADPLISYSVCSTLSLAGVFGIALGVHYKPTSLPTFMVPIACGLFLIFVSWIHHCRRSRKCHPGRSYCLKAVLPCLIFAIIGLVCFAFLETEENYFYVHSIWHISIALAIVFIMPAAKLENDSVTKL